MATIAAIFGMLIAGAVTWSLFPAFYSGSQKWRTSPVVYFLNRLTVTVIAGFAGGIFAASMFRETPSSAPGSAPVVSVESASKAPSAPTTPSAQTEVPPSTSVAPQTPPSPPSVTTIPAPLPQAAPGQRETKDAPQDVAVAKTAPVAADVPGIDCERPSAEYQKLVCGDPVLRQQEDRILKSIRARLNAQSSSADSSEILSKFLDFRATLNACVYKNCVENAYAEFEKRQLR